MKKQDEKYYQKLKMELSHLYTTIEANNVLKHNIDLENDVVIIVLHNHLKLTVVFEDQYKEAVICFDSRMSQYTHWHLDNFDAIKFLSDLIRDKKVFVESRLLRLIRSQFTFKILDLETYHATKKRYLGKRRKNIFTASEVIQGSLKNVFEKTIFAYTVEQMETVRLLDHFVKQYNSMDDRDHKEQYDTFFEMNEELIKLHQNNKVKIYAGDCLFDYFKSIIEHDGPEYAAIIIFTVTGNEFYMTGVCVRGKPLLKKLTSDKELKRSIKAMWGREGYYFKKS